jgi:hypothetical protein
VRAENLEEENFAQLGMHCSGLDPHLRDDCIIFTQIFTYNRLGSLFQSILDAFQGSNDALVAGDFSFFNWNIEIDAVTKWTKSISCENNRNRKIQYLPHQDSLSSQIEILDA